MMFRCASVYTCEVDDPSIALDEINAQLRKKIVLLENSVGVVMCHSEFVTSGVLEHILKNLPFEAAGTTTSSQAVDGAAGELVLTIFIMTSDEVFFRTGMTESVRNGLGDRVKKAYSQASAGITGSPGLILIFPPFYGEVAGDEYVIEWGKLAPASPVFGGMTSDDTSDFSEARAIFNGEVNKDCMAFILCYGNIHPRFAMATLTGDDRMPYRGEITRANGFRVLEINGVSPKSYFTDIGIIKPGAAMPAFYLLPFLIDQKNRGDYDGVPVLRGWHGFDDEGAALFRGYVDEGSTFSMLEWDSSVVSGSSRQKFAELATWDGVNGILAFSCVIRRMVLMRGDAMEELNMAGEALGEIPFMMGYVGGELCPTSVKNDIPVNRFHNFSMIILIL